MDEPTGLLVVIEKFPNPFCAAHLSSEIYRKIRLFTKMRHENIIGLVDIFLSPLDDIYLVTENMAADLQELLAFRPLDPQYIQYFLYQIFRGLKYAHSAGVIHFDLRPSNILINERGDLKICNFGFSRQLSQATYESASFYRGPETLFAWQIYDEQLDIWSVACIFGEMLEQRPLFFGKEPIDQVSVIIELLGTPPDYLNLALRSEDTSRFVESLPRRERQPLATKFRTAGSDAVSLLESMLVFDPKKRICAKEALSHPYLQPYHDPTDEPETEKLCELSDHIELPTDIWKIMIYSEIINFHELRSVHMSLSESS